MYFKTNDSPTTYFDVDSTLVLWDDIDDIPPTVLKSHTGKYFDVVIHEEHVVQLKKLKLRGGNIIVWSAGGAEWASRVVDQLGIAMYVDAVLCKPAHLFDDSDYEYWMPKRRYLESEKYEIERSSDPHLYDTNNSKK